MKGDYITMRKKLITMLTAAALAVTTLIPTTAVNAEGVGEDIFTAPSLEISLMTGEQEDYVVGEPLEYTLTIWAGTYADVLTRTTSFIGPNANSVTSFEWNNGTEWVDASGFEKTYTMSGNEYDIPFRATFSEDGVYVWKALLVDPEGTELRLSARFLILEDGILTVQPRAPHPTGLAAAKVNGKHKLTWDALGDNSCVVYRVYVNGECLTDAEGNDIQITTNEYYIDDSVFPTDGAYDIEVTAESLNNNRESALNEDYVISYNVVKTNEYAVTVDGEAYATVEEGNTVTLPTTANIGYYADGKLYKAGSTYTVTKDVDFSAVSVSVVNAAGIRFATPSGMRFRTVISSNNSAVFNSAIKSEGTLIAPKDVCDENGGQLDITSSYALNVANSGWYNTTGTYCASIVNIAESNYGREFVAKAYVTAEYADGTTTTIYSNSSDGRSIKGVAAAIKLAAEYNTLTAEQQALIDAFAAVE